MIRWLIAVNDKCRNLAEKATDALAALEREDEHTAKRTQDYMRSDYKALVDLWDEVDPEKKHAGRLGAMARHIGFGMANDYKDILRSDLPDVQRQAERLALAGSQASAPTEFEQMLHPVIKESSLRQLKDGHLREAVMNSVTAVYDLIRARTGLALDGNALATQAFGMENGRLIFSELGTESGESDQKGFMQICQGIYTGIRNPKAHTLNHDLTPVKAAQYLVMMSLIARRVEECKERS